MTEQWAELRSAVVAAWRRSDQVFALLDPAAMQMRPIDLRHPFCFYVGHLAAFAHNQVAVGMLEREPSHPTFARLFEFGIDPLDDVPGAQSWPEMAAIVAYRDAVREEFIALFDDVASLANRDELARHGRIFHVVIEHELMHHETLMYMIAQLDPSLKTPPNTYALPTATTAPAAEVVCIAGGDVTLGVGRDDIAFAWDNESPAVQASVTPFAIDRWAVSNEAFAAFVDAGGYEDRRRWDPAGWAWRDETGLHRPTTWVDAPNGGYAVASTFETVPWALASSWPAQVSQAEAEAYCRWRGGALPTEAQLKRCTTTGDVAHNMGTDPQDQAWTSMWTARPVNAPEPRDNPSGLAQLHSNGWEWTSTPFAPYPGFAAWIRTYPGYSANFFDGRHRVMVGGSWATDARLRRPSFRNWFQRLYPYAFSKFRCAYPA